MSKPSRPSDPNNSKGFPRTFFAATRTAGGRSLFQTNRMANLFVDVLRSTMRSGKVTIHDFVVMPDHIHILMTVPGEMSVEKAMQLIKGGFSFRAKKELGFTGEIWQRGFSDVRVKAGLAISPEDFQYGTAYLKKRKRAGAEAQSNTAARGTAKVVVRSTRNCSKRAE
jgi:putative transposase